MKKFKTLFLILCTCLFVLCGCSSSDNQNSSNAGKTSYSTSAPKKETEISSFTTDILDQTPNRVDNIALTCSKINGIIVKQGETFSFCNTVGKVSSDTGYKEADVLDAEGKPFKGYGGGNCQVSSTLYNAVLMANLEIVERKNVEKDKDAAVDSSSNLDFKFKNNSENDIKIYASNTDKDITIRLMKLE